jgi:hypothetical protein
MTFVRPNATMRFRLLTLGVGPWKGPGRKRRAGGSAVAFDEFIKPVDDGELLG